jgi:threonylcarbamoyladenosine tRNA methylthiotransferase MtaB
MSQREQTKAGRRREVITLGCRLNTYESEIVGQHLDSAGLEDTVVINTCAVTAEAVRQARQTIRRVRRDNPGARVIVTGCAAQIEPETFARMAEVDHVIGNTEKLDAATYRALQKGFGTDELERVRVNDIMSVTETAGHLIDAQGRMSRSRTAATTAAHSASFRSVAARRGPCRWATWWRRCDDWSRAAITKSCSPAST